MLHQMFRMQLLAYDLHNSAMTLVHRAVQLEGSMEGDFFYREKNTYPIEKAELSPGSWHKPVSGGLIDKKNRTAHQKLQSLLLLPHQACAVLDRVSNTKSLLLTSATITQQIR